MDGTQRTHARLDTHKNKRGKGIFLEETEKDKNAFKNAIFRALSALLHRCGRYFISHESFMVN